MSKLNDNQKLILKDFITHFLPKRGNNRKYSTNEIGYVQRTLDKVFIQNFGFNISGKQILEEFEELGYTIFTKNGLWDSETKILKPSSKGNVITSNESNSGYDACFIYIDIDQSVVKQLMISTTVANANTSEIKLEKEMKMKKELQSFKQNILSKL
jgi:hypothetical protein